MFSAFSWFLCGGGGGGGGGGIILFKCEDVEENDLNTTSYLNLTHRSDHPTGAKEVMVLLTVV